MSECNHEWHLAESDYNYSGGKTRKPYKGRAFFVCSKCGEWNKKIKEKDNSTDEITPTTVGGGNEAIIAEIFFAIIFLLIVLTVFLL